MSNEQEETVEGDEGVVSPLDRLLSGTRAALAGGTTMVMDFALPNPEESLLAALDRWHNKSTIAHCDYSFHMAITWWGEQVFDDMKKGLEGVDVVMMLRLQQERMQGAFVPSTREYYHRYGLDVEKLALAKDDAIVMHPGPMNRGVEIDPNVADDINRSVIQEQVEMGVAVRMAVMDLLARNIPNA